MPLFVLTGPDTHALRARRAQLLAETGARPNAVERFDVSLDGGARLAEAAATYSLFGGHRVLDADPAGSLSIPAAERLHASQLPDVTVILRGPSALPAAVRKALPDAIVETFSSPTPHTAQARVVSFADGQGVTLTPDARDVLTSLAPSNWSLVCGVLVELAAQGLTDAGASDVRPLTGTAPAPSTPWALADALEAGDLPAALALAAHLEPIPTIAYLAKRAAQVGQLADAGVRDPAVAAVSLGVSAAAARKLAALAARLGPDGMLRTWDLLGAADRAGKLSASAGDVLTVLTVHLAGVWGAPRA